MSRALGSFTRVMPYGFGWSVFPEDLKFGGILQLEITCGGTLKAIWENSEDALFYNIFVRANDADVFQPEFSIGKVQGTLSEAKFRTLSDNFTLLNSMEMMFVGVREITAEGEDDNEIVLNVRPATFGENVFVNDRHFSTVH